MKSAVGAQLQRILAQIDVILNQGPGLEQTKMIQNLTEGVKNLCQALITLDVGERLKKELENL
jgi:hypothetical protein